MNMCQMHWDALRAAIDSAGLSHLVAENGKRAIESITCELNEEDTVIDFDPLLGSAFQLENLAMRYRGMWMIQPDENGKMPCPVCAMETFPWVEYIASSAQGEAIRRGLIEA